MRILYGVKTGFSAGFGRSTWPVAAFVGALVACSSDPAPTQGSSDTLSAGTDITGADTTAPGDVAPTDTQKPCGTDDAPCDDGDPCTKNDVCQAGKCVGTDDICACRTTADCLAKHTGDLCSGTPYCNKDALPYTCVINPATVVDCPAIGAACQQNGCDAATGKCAVTPKTGAACDDGNVCTHNDKCAATGKCAGGENFCKCDSDKDCASDEDGDLCNGTLFCQKTAEKRACAVDPQTIVNCSPIAKGPCLVDACQPQSGKCAAVPAPANTGCDDGDTCTKSDMCSAGTCKPGASVCTCTAHADCAKFEDGNTCNGTLFCDSGACTVNPATVVVCPTNANTTCLASACQKATGICSAVPINENNACEDGNDCTKTEACKAGKCVSDTPVCACKSNTDCAQHEDGNACNGTLYCDKTASGNNCAINPVTIVSCAQDDQPCSVATCQPTTGGCIAVPLPTTATCTDANACTQGDHCQDGVCEPGTSACICQSDNDCAKFEDGNACNGTLFCNITLPKHACELNPSSLKTCPTVDDTACTKNLCAPKTGLCALTAAPDNSHCTDANPCTVADHCQQGACVNGLNICDCQTDADCKAIDDGDLCNGSWSCKLDGAVGHCVAQPPVVCQGGGDACTAIGCFGPTGVCQPLPKTDGTACDDGNPCSANDACKSGGCTPGTAVAGCCLYYDKTSKKGASGLSDRFRAVAAAGNSTYACGDAQSSKGPFDVRVVKLDIKGNAQWDKLYASEVANKSCTKLAVTGETVVFAGSSFHGNNSQDAWFVAIDAGSGLQKWQHWFGGAGFDTGTGVATGHDGGGVVQIGLAMEDKTTTTNATLVRVQSLSDGGKLSWSTALSKAGDSVDHARITAAGTGWLVGYGGGDPKTGAGEGFAMQNLDSAGKTLWTAWAKGDTAHIVGGITPLAKGGFALAGRGAGVGLKQGCRFVRVSNTGAVAADATLLASSNGRCNDAIELGHGGGIALAGEIAGQQVDGWFAVVDADGKVAWQTPLGTAGNDRAFGVAATAGGGLLFVGGKSEPGSKFADDGWLRRTDDAGKASCP